MARVRSSSDSSRIVGWPVPYFVSGVYGILYRPSGGVYVGGSGRCVYNRMTHHLFKLRRGTHNLKFQEEWDNSVPEDWEIQILEICTPDLVQERETYWIGQYDLVYNAWHDATGKTKRWSPEDRKKMSESRARYLDTPGAREKLAEKARQQHAEGNFGAHTWKSR